MSLPWTLDLKHLMWGHLLKSVESESIFFHAILGDLRPLFIPKGRIGRGYRAISRNGRVLLASRVPLEELAGREVMIRLQAWRKIILPGERPQNYGILMSVGLTCCNHHSSLDQSLKEGVFISCLSSDPQWGADLTLDVGGRMTLAFVREKGMETFRAGDIWSLS